MGVGTGGDAGVGVSATSVVFAGVSTPTRSVALKMMAKIKARAMPTKKIKTKAEMG